MSESLREQLIKAGLVKQQQASPKKGSKPQRNKKKSTSRSAPMPGGMVQNKQDSRPQARPPVVSTAQTDQSPSLVRATKAELREFIAKHRCNDPDAEMAYYFQLGDKIKHVYVTATQQEALVRGELAIAFLDGRRNLLPVTVARQFLAMDSQRTVVFTDRDDPDVTASVDVTSTDEV